MLRPRTILLAEPEAALRESWRSGLAAMGFHVGEAGTAAPVLQMAREAETALVITELYLETETERCLVRAARREPALDKLKILVVSEHASEEDREWALAAGADTYLIKPIRIGRLLRVAARLATSPTRPRAAWRDIHHSSAD